MKQGIYRSKSEAAASLGCLSIAAGLLWATLIALVSVLSDCAAFASDRLQPNDLVYEGAFLFPKRTGVIRFGYGARALAFNPNGDEGRGTLVASSHVHFPSVGEATIPDPVVPISKDPVQAARELAHGNQVQAFVEIAGNRQAINRTRRLDRLGGLAVIGNRVFWSFYRYYSVQPPSAFDFASIGSSSLDFANLSPKGHWKVGPYGDNVFHFKRTSNYLATIPRDWANQHAGGRGLAMGKGDGAGNASNSQGPSLYAVEHRVDPGADGVLQATALIHYPPGGGFFPWSKCDRWEGLAWIDTGENQAVVFAGRRGRGEECYGKPVASDPADGECLDPCLGGKGYHCHPYEAELIFYDPDALILVANGTIEPHEISPFATRSLQAEFLETCSADIGGMAYDERSGRLFLVQQNGENPVVHVWRVAGQDHGPIQRHVVKVSVEGAETTFKGETLVEAMAMAAAFLNVGIVEEVKAND